MPEPSVRILVTGAGGPAALGLMRSLEASDIETYAADIDPYAQGLYHVPAERRLIVPRGDDPDFAHRLRVECLARRISLVVPTVESELASVAGQRDAFRRDGIELMAPAAEALRKCLDKWRLFESLDGHEYLPRTRLLDSRFDPGGWVLPVFVKPRRASGSNGARRIETQQELASLPRDGSLIVQELLPGAEFSVDVLRLHAGTPTAASAERRGREVEHRLIAVVRERLKIDSGIAVASRVVRNPELESVACQLVSEIRVGPISNVQFRADPAGRPRLLEINPRVPGTIALTVAAGVNMPLLAVRAALGRGADLAEPTIRPVAMVRALEDRVVPLSEIADMEELAGRGEGVPA